MASSAKMLCPTRDRRPVAVGLDQIRQWRPDALRIGWPGIRVEQINPSRDEGWPAIYYFYPENVVDLHAEAKRKEFQVSDLRVTFYGMKESEVRDPDGHILWFGQGTDKPPTSERQSR
jgi:hypothetical protein